MNCCISKNVLTLDSSRTSNLSFVREIKKFISEVFLPQGYPGSVSNDYWNYQLWDSIQAFCSTLSGTLATEAILKGVGVGDAGRTSLSATITWILKDGTGMVGRILFTWMKGVYLDAECKKWRLFADFLNDAAMYIEMFLLPILPMLSTEVLCLSTTMKAIVGVAGGATKASVTQHQAIRNNLGDVSAKDGSQETCLNLIGSIFALFLLSFVSGSTLLVNMVFILCTLFHLYSNYRAVKALKFQTLNKERLLILIDKYLEENINFDPDKVNDEESVILGCGLTAKKVCGFDIKIGCSLKKLIDDGIVTTEILKSCVTKFENCNHMILVCERLKCIFVPLKSYCDDEVVLLAYFHAVLVGLSNSTSSLNLSKTKKVVNLFDRSGSTGENTEIKKEFIRFKDYLNKYGWEINNHHVLVGEWRASWGEHLDSELK